MGLSSSNSNGEPKGDNLNPSSTKCLRATLNLCEALANLPVPQQHWWHDPNKAHIDRLVVERACRAKLLLSNNCSSCLLAILNAIRMMLRDCSIHLQAGHSCRAAHGSNYNVSDVTIVPGSGTETQGASLMVVPAISDAIAATSILRLIVEMYIESQTEILSDTILVNENIR
jgi:hypothetical protein